MYFLQAYSQHYIGVSDTAAPLRHVLPVQSYFSEGRGLSGALPAAYCLRAIGPAALPSYYSIERLSVRPHDPY